MDYLSDSHSYVGDCIYINYIECYTENVRIVERLIKMKFTSEDLLKFFGLKVGDEVKVQHGKGSSFEWLIYKVIIDEFENVLLDNPVHKVQISFLANKEYTIIQPKPTLTEDEKNKLKDLLSRNYKWISRDNVCIPLFASSLKPKKSEHFVKYGNGCAIPKRMFEFIEPMETYSIEELLKDN